MMLNIEAVSADNVDDLIALLDGLAEFERLDPPDAEAKERLRRDLLAPDAQIEGYLARAKGYPVGCITLVTTYSTFAALPVLYLEDLFVVEDYRRHGVGQQLLDFCMALARKRGCARLEWNVLKWNQAAIDFYEKNGAKRVDDWSWYRLKT